MMMFDEIHWCWSECCDLGPHACICGNDCEPDGENDMSNSGPKYPNIEVSLSNEDGNAVAMVTRVVLAMRDDGVGRDEVDSFRDEALSGDYEHVIDTIEEWVNVS